VGKPPKMSLRNMRLLTSKLFLLGLFILGSCVGDNIKSEEMILIPGDSLHRTVLRAEGKNINGLDLLIKGEIKGSGQLSIGDTDSTFYKTYDLTEGKIEIEYRGDWYSEFCYVTYKPAQETKGQLKIDGDFFGD
jgi:hypothetical protein